MVLLLDAVNEFSTWLKFYVTVTILKSHFLFFLNKEIEALDLSNSMCKSQDLVIYCGSIIFGMFIIYRYWDRAEIIFMLLDEHQTLATIFTILVLFLNCE